MQTPLEIAFHNLPPSDALEAEIRQRVDKLARLYDRMTACRVSVEAAHQQHHTSNLYEVHVVMAVPGTELVVSREPHHARERHAAPDVRTSIRNAFQAAERQLKEYKRRIRGDTKRHEAMIQGAVAEINPDEDHGFILTGTGTQLYFHRSSVIGDSLDALKHGDAVHYVEIDGDTGPIAHKVWRAGQRHD